MAHTISFNEVIHRSEMHTNPDPNRATKVTNVVTELVKRNKKFEGPLTQPEAQVLVGSPEASLPVNIIGWFLRVAIIDDKGRALDVETYLNDKNLARIMLYTLYAIVLDLELEKHSFQGKKVVTELKKQVQTDSFLVKTDAHGGLLVYPSTVEPYFGTK